MPTTSPGLSRNQRSRQRMRLKLVDAAHRVMARKGIVAATINEITEEADVGFGSFYNYFKTKEELARAVFVAQNLELGEQFDLLNLNVHDPRQKLSRNILRGAEKAREDPVFGWFQLHAITALQDVRSAFWDRMMTNSELGLKEGKVYFPRYRDHRQYGVWRDLRLASRHPRRPRRRGRGDGTGRRTW